MKKKKHARRLSAHVYTIQDLKNAPYRKIMHAPFHGAFDGAQLLSGKVLARDWRVAGSSLTGVIALCP